MSLTTSAPTEGTDISVPPADDSQSEPVLRSEPASQSELLPVVPDRTWLPPAMIAVAALGSLACFVGSQFLESRTASTAAAATRAGLEMHPAVDKSSTRARSDSAQDAGPPVATAVDAFHFLPKAPSTGHLLAVGRPTFQFVAVPRVDVAVPVGVREEPPVDPKHQEAVRRFAERITELDQDRASLVAIRTEAIAEKERHEKIIEQGKKDLQANVEKGALCEVALTAVQLEIDAYQAEILLQDPNSPRPINNPRSVLLPKLTLQRAQLRLDLEKLRTENEMLRLRNESAYKQLLTMPPRLKKLSEQGEFLRKQWVTDCCDWWGKRTAAENTEAVRLFTAALEKESSNFGAKLGRAVALARLGRTADALRDLGDAEVRTNPFRAEATALRGYIKAHHDDEAKGLAEMGQAVAMDRRSIVPLLLRGQMYCRQARFPTALADFRAAAQIDATNPEPRRYLALYYATANHQGPRNLREAAAAAKEAVDLSNGTDWQALLALAATEADAGRFDEAAKLAAEAADLTFDTHRERCRELEKLFAAGTPLRLEWTLAGK